MVEKENQQQQSRIVIQSKNNEEEENITINTQQQQQIDNNLCSEQQQQRKCAEEVIAEAAKRNREKKSTRHGARNQHRHKSFVQWLLKTFPDAFQKSSSSSQNQNEQSHVLDVAGGKGEVSARLSICHNQKVVLIDPRKADIHHCFATLVLPKLPKKWQQRIREREEEHDHRFIKETILQERFRQLEMELTERIVQPILDDNNNSGGSTTSSNIFNENNESETTTTPSLRYAIENASIIIGLHADSATEIIIDLALRYSKPFVVVPCCVFPKLFPQRMLRCTTTTDNNPVASSTMIQVRTYEQFCRYLYQKDDRFQIDVLPFDGRNIAIYWNGHNQQ